MLHSIDEHGRLISVSDMWLAKLGYTPWTTARNFSLGRAGCFGLVMEDSQNEWITQILGGIEEELAIGQAGGGILIALEPFQKMHEPRRHFAAQGRRLACTRTT